MAKKIIFRPNSDLTFKSLNSPAPSKNFIPNWYKDSPKFSSGKMKFSEIDGLNRNYKTCIPFLDIMMAGYIIELPYDLLVEKRGSEISFGWADAESLIKPRLNLVGMPRPAGHYDQAYAWTFSWGVQTPPGYSSIITHPFNRHDLPFVTTSGIVDSDQFSQGGEIPFFLREDFEGIIQAGTPIAQIIPFKREPWESKAAPYDDSFFQKQVYSVRKHLTGAYKKYLWQRKSYS
jgi:hypothetical protein